MESGEKRAERRFEPLDAAVNMCLIEHEFAIRERNKLRTEKVWPDLSDIYDKTRKVLSELYAGTLNPNDYMDSLRLESDEVSSDEA